MPRYKDGEALNIVIAVSFPGGRLGWTKAGCDLVCVPVPGGRTRVYVLLPAQTTDTLDLRPLRRKMEGLAKEHDWEVHYVSEGNFEGMDPAEVKRVIERCLENRGKEAAPNTLLVRPAVVAASVEGTRLEAEMVAQWLIGIDGVRQVVVTCRSGAVELARPRNAPAHTPKARTALEPARGDRPVSFDDVAWVCWLLQRTRSVDEFLQGLAAAEGTPG